MKTRYIKYFVVFLKSLPAGEAWNQHGFYAFKTIPIVLINKIILCEGFFFLLFVDYE